MSNAACKKLDFFFLFAFCFHFSQTDVVQEDQPFSPGAACVNRGFLHSICALEGLLFPGPVPSGAHDGLVLMDS